MYAKTTCIPQFLQYISHERKMVAALSNNRSKTPTLLQTASFYQRFPSTFLRIIRCGRLPRRSLERSPEFSFSRRLICSWYSAKSSFIWLNYFIVFYKSYLRPYLFQQTRYLVVPSSLV